MIAIVNLEKEVADEAEGLAFEAEVKAAVPDVKTRVRFTAFRLGEDVVKAQADAIAAAKIAVRPEVIAEVTPGIVSQTVEDVVTGKIVDPRLTVKK